MRDLTPDEARAVAALRRVAKTWPKTLTLALDGRSKLRVVDAEEARRADDLGTVPGEPTGLEANASSS